MKLIRITTVGKIIWFFLIAIFVVIIIGIVSLFPKKEPNKPVFPKNTDSEKIIDYTDSIYHTFDFDNGIESENDLIVIKESGTYKLIGNNLKYKIVIDSPHGIVKLIFSSFNSNIMDKLISVKNAYKVIIEFENGTQNNILYERVEGIEPGKSTIISSSVDIDFIGTGTLRVETPDKFLDIKGNINFKEATLEVNSASQAFNISGNFKLENGTLYVSAKEIGFNSDGNITIDDGTFIVRAPLAVKNGGIFIINKGNVFLASLEEIQKPNANSLQKTLILNFKEVRNKLLLLHDTTQVVLAYVGELDYQHILYSTEFKADSYVLYGNAKIAGNQKYGLYNIEEVEEDTQLTTDGLVDDHFLTKELVNIYNDIVKK